MRFVRLTQPNEAGPILIEVGRIVALEPSVDTSYRPPANAQVCVDAGQPKWWSVTETIEEVLAAIGDLDEA
jgi:hypothetical protein